LDDLGCLIFNTATKRAIVATFVVCSQSRPAAGPPVPAVEGELEVEIVE
jgi:hypothetical protein